MTHPLQATIEELWERRTELSPQSPPTTIAAIESVMSATRPGASSSGACGLCRCY